MDRADTSVIPRHSGAWRPAAFWALARGHNAAIAAVGVLVGAWWTTGRVAIASVLFAAASAFFLGCFANAFNDARDIAIDRVAHPTRPLPSGLLTPADARAAYLTSAALALLAAIASHAMLAIASIAVLVLMWTYTVSLKRVGLVGNIVVAVLASLPFLYGAAASGGWRSGVGLFLTAAPLHLAREVAKDMDDVGGDAGHRRTLPLAGSRRTAIAVLVAAAVLHVCAVLVLARGIERLTTLMLPAFVLVALGVHRAALARAGAPLLLKAAMLAAMVALVLARARLSPS